MTEELSTALCTPKLHEKYGGACFYCCPTCNHDRHVCHFCGDTLKHDGRLWNGEINTCYATCVCGHIGHEHYRDQCSGFNFATQQIESCTCRELRPS